MASKREIKRRVLAVKNTSKITRAMKLVSAAKLRKAQEAVHNTRAYTDAVCSLVARLLRGGGDTLSHPLLEPRGVTKRRRVLVIGGSRGLCGSYNSNVNRGIERFVREGPGRDGLNEFSIVGKRPADYFRRVKRDFTRSWEDLPEDATRWPVGAIAQELTDEFLSEGADEVWVIYTKFRSAISMTVVAEQVLPLTKEVMSAAIAAAQGSSSGSGHGHHQATVQNASGHDQGGAGSTPTVFEPSPEATLAALLPRLVVARILQACLDAKAGEYGSRMTAMETATKNANELGRKLNLLYNRLRQAGITGELLDIVGGAEAMK